MIDIGGLTQAAAAAAAAAITANATPIKRIPTSNEVKMVQVFKNDAATTALVDAHCCEGGGWDAVVTKIITTNAAQLPSSGALAAEYKDQCKGITELAVRNIKWICAGGCHPIAAGESADEFFAQLKVASKFDDADQVWLQAVKQFKWMKQKQEEAGFSESSGSQADRGSP